MIFTTHQILNHFGKSLLIIWYSVYILMQVSDFYIPKKHLIEL